VVANGRCDTIQWGDGGRMTKLNSAIKKVHIVYMAHLDVGYTVPSVKQNLQQYVQEYFPLAWNTSETLRARAGEESFAWTSHAWLIDALLRNQSGAVPAGSDFISKLEASIQRGDTTWHANPMNLQEESGESNHLSFGLTIAEKLDRRFNKPKKVAASQKDAPGVSLAMLRTFKDHGVRMLHVGVNDFSTVPAFPEVSAPYHGYCNPGRLRDTGKGDIGPSPDPGAVPPELMLLYCSGYSGPYQLGLELPNQMTLVPGFDEALVYLMHVDNRGPQTAEQVLEGWTATQRVFPNAVLHSSSMDAWLQAFEQAEEQPDGPSLPVVDDVEMGDTWTFGVPSDPTKTRAYRAVTRLVTEEIQAGAINTSAHDFQEFYTILLKLPEHTWGYTGAGCAGADWSNSGWRSPTSSCRFGSAQYTTARNSYVDQRNFTLLAIEALTGPTAWLRPKLIAAIQARDPVPVSTVGPQGEGWLPFDVTHDGTVTVSRPSSNRSVVAVFNASGAITSLRVGNVTMADPQHPLGLFQYRTHSEDELNLYGDEYCLDHCRADCGRCGFSKCDLSKAGAVSSRNAPLVVAAWRRGQIDSEEQSFFFNVSFAGCSGGPALLEQYGAPAFATIKVSINATDLDPGPLRLTVDLTWYGKQPTRMAESLWMTFAPQTGQGAANWRMDKLGRWVDPFQVARNGSQTMHALASGVQQLARDRPAGGAPEVMISSPDAPVVSPNVALAPLGTFGPKVLPQPEDGWAWNLFNNAWSTNFPLWSLDPSARFQWALELRPHS